MATDWELALRHRYVTQHGRKPAPGVTSIDILDKGGLKWGAARIAAQEAVLNYPRMSEIVGMTRAMRPKATLSPIVVGDDAYDSKLKIPMSEADDEDVYAYWARGRFDQVWKAKADRGSRVHAHAESWIAGIPITPLEDEVGYMDALERFWEECEPEFHFAEIIVVNPSPEGHDEWEYGGRPDHFVTLHRGPRQGDFLGDWKTGGHYSGPIALQSAGYLGAMRATYLDNGDLGPLEPLPKVDTAIDIYLRADGTYGIVDAFQDIPRELAWATFLHLRAVLDFKRLTDKLDKEDE
jgi:hypothetical protein